MNLEKHLAVEPTFTGVSLDRISETELIAMLKNELVFCVKGLTKFFHNQTPNNSQMRHLIQQMSKCIKRYEPYLQKQVVDECRVEAGEMLLETLYCYRIANVHFFRDEYKEGSDLHYRAFYGRMCASFMEILDFDTSLQNVRSVDKIVELMKQIAALVQGLPKEKKMQWVTFHGIYHLMKMAEILEQFGWKSNALATIMWLPDFFPTVFYTYSHIFTNVKQHIYLTLYRYYLEQNQNENALQMVTFASADLDQTERMELSASAPDPLDPEIVKCIQSCRYRLNLMQSGIKAILLVMHKTEGNEKNLSPTAISAGTSTVPNFQPTAGQPVFVPSYFLNDFKNMTLPEGFVDLDMVRDCELYRLLPEKSITFGSTSLFSYTMKLIKGIKLYDTTLGQVKIPLVHFPKIHFVDTNDKMEIDKKAAKKKVYGEPGYDDYIKKRQLAIDFLHLFNGYTNRVERFNALMQYVHSFCRNNCELGSFVPPQDTLHDFAIFRIIDIAYNCLFSAEPLKMDQYVPNLFEGKIPQKPTTYRRYLLLDPNQVTNDLIQVEKEHLLTFAKLLTNYGLYNYLNHLHVYAPSSPKEHLDFSILMVLNFAYFISTLGRERQTPFEELSIQPLPHIPEPSLQLQKAVRQVSYALLMFLNTATMLGLADKTAVAVLKILQHTGTVEWLAKRDVGFCRHYVIILKRLCHHQGVQGANFIQSVARSYEKSQNYEDALEFWQAGLSLLHKARIALGDSLLEDISFMQSELKSTRSLLTSIHVDFIGSLYRCYNLQTQRLEKKERARKEQQFERLNQTKASFKEASIIPPEEIIEKQCGDDPIKRALFYLSISATGDKTHLEEKLDALERAYRYLKKAQQLESKLDSVATRDDVSLEIIKKSSTFCTVRVKTNLDCKWARLKCSMTNEPVYASDNFTFLGSGLFFPFEQKQVELGVFELQPNKNYYFIAELFGDDLNTPVCKSDVVCAVAALPLPCLQLWAYISQTAHVFKVDRLADTAFEMMLGTMVKHQTEDSLLLSKGETHLEQQWFELHESVKQATPAVMHGFVQAVLARIERSKRLLEEDVSPDGIGAKMFRLKSLRLLMIASSCAKTIGEHHLELLCAMHMYHHMQPFLINEIANDFCIQCASFAIQIFVTHGDPEDKALIESYIGPLLYHMTARLVKNGHYLLAYTKFTEIVNQLNAKGVRPETRIPSSILLEQTLLGSVRKIKNIKGQLTRAYCLSEFGFHASAAIKKGPESGLQVNDNLYVRALEEADLLIAMHSQIVPFVPQSEKENQDEVVQPTDKPILIGKRILDQQCQLKDLYMVYATSGLEWTLQELQRFKKSPRYVELIGLIIEWLHAKESFDLVIKTANDLDDYLEKRSQTFLKFDEVFDAGEGYRDVLTKRVRRFVFEPNPHLKMDSIKGIPSAKAAKAKAGDKKAVKSRFEKSDKSNFQKPVEARLVHVGNLNDLRRRRLSVATAFDGELKEADSVMTVHNSHFSQELLPGTTSEYNLVSPTKENFAGSPPSRSPARVVSRPVSPRKLPISPTKEEPESPTSPTAYAPGSPKKDSRPGSPKKDSRPGSPQKESRPNSSRKDAPGSPKRESRPASAVKQSRPPSPKKESRPASPQRDQLKSSQKSKQDGHSKKTTELKVTLANGLVIEHEKFDQAVKVLHSTMIGMWRQSRYRRRMRSMLQLEAPHRVNILVKKGLALQYQIQKDLKQEGQESEPFDTEWLHLRNSGDIFIDFYNWNRAETPVKDQEHHSDAAEMLQCFVQATVIASRAKNTLGVFTGAIELWKAVKMLLHHKKLSTLFWKKTLWRGLFIAAGNLLGVLEKSHLVKIGTDSLFKIDSEGNVNDYRLHSMPIRSMIELQSGQYGAFYSDASGQRRFHLLDLNFASSFALFTIETLYHAQKYHRVLGLSSRVQTVFRGCFDPILTQVIKRTQAAIQSTPITETEKQDAQDYLIEARRTSIQTILDKLDPKPVVELYRQALERSQQEQNRHMFMYCSHELGNFLFETGDTSGAAVYWSTCVDSIFGSKKFVKNWRKDLTLEHMYMSVKLDKPSFEHLRDKAGGLLYCWTASMCIANIARYVYFANHDQATELIWLSSALLIATLQDIIQVEKLVEGSDPYIYEFVQVFQDKHQLNPTKVVDILQFLCRNLLDSGLSLMSLHLSWMMRMISTNYLGSKLQASRASMLTVEGLVLYGKFQQGISRLCELAKKSYPFTEEEMGKSGQFDEQKSYLDSQQLQVLKLVGSLQMVDKKKQSISVSHQYFEFTKSKAICDIISRYNILDKHVPAQELMETLESVRESLLVCAERMEATIKQKIEKQETGVLYLLQARLVRIFYMITMTFFMGGQYRVAADWAYSLRKYMLQNTQIVSVLGSEFVLSIRYLIARCFMSEGLFSQAFEMALEGIYTSMSHRSTIYGLQFSIQTLLCMRYDKSIVYLQWKGVLNDMKLLLERAEKHPFGKYAVIRAQELMADYISDAVEAASAYESVLEMAATAGVKKSITDVVIYQCSVKKQLQRLAELGKASIANELFDCVLNQDLVVQHFLRAFAYYDVGIALVHLSGKINDRDLLLKAKQLFKTILDNQELFMCFGSNKIKNLYNYMISIQIALEDSQIFDLLIQASIFNANQAKEQSLMESTTVVKNLDQETAQFLFDYQHPLHLTDLNLSETVNPQMNLSQPTEAPLGSLVQLKNYLMKGIEDYILANEWEYVRFRRLARVRELIDSNAQSDYKTEKIGKYLFFMWIPQHCLGLFKKEQQQLSIFTPTARVIKHIPQSDIERTRELIDELLLAHARAELLENDFFQESQELWIQLLKKIQLMFGYPEKEAPPLCLGNLLVLKQLFSLETFGYNDKFVLHHKGNPYLDQTTNLAQRLNPREYTPTLQPSGSKRISSLRDLGDGLLQALIGFTTLSLSRRSRKDLIKALLTILVFQVSIHLVIFGNTRFAEFASQQFDFLPQTAFRWMYEYFSWIKTTTPLVYYFILRYVFPLNVDLIFFACLRDLSIDATLSDPHVARWAIMQSQKTLLELSSKRIEENTVYDTLRKMAQDLVFRFRRTRTGGIAFFAIRYFKRLTILTISLLGSFVPLIGILSWPTMTFLTLYSYGGLEPTLVIFGFGLISPPWLQMLSGPLLVEIFNKQQWFAKHEIQIYGFSIFFHLLSHFLGPYSIILAQGACAALVLDILDPKDFEKLE
ncbi:hypothetical protein EDD86DRAFT_273112, partial [Gorgonomyces haynaldii]